MSTRFQRRLLLLLLLLLGSQNARAQLVTNAIFAGNSFGQTNQIWKYEETNDVSALGWQTTLYNDSAWPSGRALLAGEASAWVLPFLGKTLLLPNNTAASPPQGHARYFRTHFNWPTSPVGVTLNFNARADDGFIMYLNGTEIWRLRPPPDPITHASAGSPLPCGGDADCGDDLYSTNSTALVQGDNVLAVVVYQNAVGSSDLVWGTGLSAILPYPPSVLDATQPSNRVVVIGRLTTLNMAVLASPPPTYQWFFQPSGGGAFTAVTDAPGISGATTAALTISNTAVANAGSYFCTAMNAVGMTNSRTAVLQTTVDTNPPVVVRAAGSATFDRFVLVFDEPLEPTVATDTVNYNINGLNPTIASISPDGTTVTLDSVHNPDTDYTISIPDLGLSDPVGNFMSATQFVVHSYIITSCGGMLFEAYTNAGASTAVTDLLNNPNFPNRPNVVVRTNGFASDLAWAGLGNTDPKRENYGARMRALFFPTNTGLYRLYLWADDGGQLYFNPNGPSAAGKQLVLNRTACCGDFTSANSRTAAYPLQAGQGYYVEALFKEAGGGDYGQVAARPEGQATPPTSEYIPGDQLGYTAVPPGVVGQINISQQPTNIAVEAPNPGTFAVVASANNAPFVCFQWQKAESGSGVFNDIPGAITPVYITGSTSVAADNGDQYRVVINALSGSLTSAVATLTVNADVTRPRVVKVVSTSSTGVSVIYSEPMSVDATDTVNYSLNGGVSAVGAAVNPGNPNRIDLTTSLMTLGNLYTLTIPPSGGSMTDPSGNTINPNPTVATFRSQTFSGDPANVINVPTNGVLPIGALTNRGLLVRLIQISVAKPNGNTVTEQVLGGVYPSALGALPNIAPLPLYWETGAINYNKDGPTSADGNLTPDAQFPGFGNVPLAALDNLVFEAVCYVELRQGVYRTIVRSDDAFRLSTGLSVEDTNTFMLGQFDAGRGVDDTPLIDFCISRDGLYPMRLIFEEGNGGAAIEWKIADLETPGAFYGVNSGTVAGGFPGGSPKAFTPLCVDPALNIQVNGASLVIAWPLAGGGNLYQLQSTTTLANPPSATVWSNVGVVPQTSGITKRVTLPNAGARTFFRLSRPGPDCSP